MSEHGDALSSRIRSAMESSNPDDIVVGVKDAVADEMLSLSPDATIIRTEYFNHSYMPDLMLEWNDLGRKNERPIFLRNTLRPSVVEEVETLAEREPVMLSLTASSSAPDQTRAIRDQARRVNRVLVTDVNSLADISSPQAQAENGAPATSQPLLRLVQTNLLKGGRGLLTTEDAQRLRSSASPDSGDGHVSDDFLTSFSSSADEIFAPDAALRLRRAAELLQFGLSAEHVETLSLTEGRLSDIDLRVLVPFLLSEATTTNRQRLWSYIGSMMSLEQLEEMWDVLADVDVSPLVIPNVEAWATSRRAQLAFNNEYELESSAENLEEQSPRRRPAWYVKNRILTSTVGPWRLFITTDARRLKGRSDSPSARWDDLAPFLSDLALDSVDLRGVSRSINVTAEQSGDVRRDVELIRQSIQDSFNVSNVRVRRLAAEEPNPDLRVDFTEMTVSADKAPIASMVLAARLLAYRNPTDFSGLIESETENNPSPET